jgi:hypothetical protein
MTRCRLRFKDASSSGPTVADLASRLARLARSIATITATSIAMAFAAVSAQAPAESQRPVRYINREWSFDDVDVATLTRWLGRIGVEVPLRLEGRISGTLSIGVPWGALRDARAWRLGGRLNSPRFSVDEVALERVRMQLAYREGSLFLDELRFEVPEPANANANGGLVTGAARMQLIPRGQFTATLEVNNLSMSSVLARLPALQPARGLLSGRIEASARVEDISQITAWRARGSVGLRGLVVKGSPPGEASVQMVLDRGTLVAREFQFTVERNEISGEASLAMREPYPWGAKARVMAPDISAAVALMNRLVPSVGLDAVRSAVEQGELTSDVDARGTLSPLSGNVTGNASLARLSITVPESVAQRIPVKLIAIDAASLRFEASPAEVRFPEIALRLAGGEIKAAVTLPWSSGAVDAAMTWTNLRVGDLVATHVVEPGATSGSLHATAPRQRLNELSAWQANLEASLSRVTYQGMNVADVQTGAIQIQNGKLSGSDLRFRLAGNPGAVALKLDLRAPYKVELSYDLPSADLSVLPRIPQVAGLASRTGGAIGVAGDLDGTLNPLALNGRGRLVGRDIELDDHQLDALKANFVFDRAKISISDVRVDAYGGSVNGTVTVPLVPEAAGAAALSWSGIELGAALRGIPQGPAAIDGPSLGSIQLSIPPGDLMQPDRWTGSAAMELAAVAAYDFDVQRLSAPNIRLHDGKIEAQSITATMDAQPVEAALELELKAPWTTVVHVHARRFRASRLAGLPYLEALTNRLTGLADANTRLSMTFDPDIAIDVDGSATVDGIAVERFDLERLSGNYRLNADSLTVTDVAASLYGGTISGQAVVPFSDEVPGSAAVRWNDVDAGQFVTDLLRPAVPLTGETRGDVDLAIPPGKLRVPAAWNVTAQVELPDVRARRRPVASIRADLTQHGGKLAYSAEGTLAGGRLDLQGTRDAALPTRGPAALGDARLTLRGARFATVRDLVGPSTNALDLTGTFNVDSASSATPESWSWRAAATTTAVSAGNLVLTPGVVVRAAGDEQGVTLQQVTGRFAGGELSGAGEWGFEAGRVRSFRVRLRQARLEQLQALAARDSEAAATGDMDFDVRTRPGAVWRFQVGAYASRANVNSVTLRNVSASLNLDWSPRSGHVLLSTTNSQLSIAGGKLSGRLTARRTANWNVDGRFRFFRVNAAKLGGSSYASGLLRGTLDLSARNARSVNDVQATLQADLEDAESKRVPVIDQIRTAVPGAGLAGATRFGEGRVEARLARRVIRFEQLSLANRRLQLYITGNATLAGRLNLEAVAATGQAANPTVASALLTNILAVPAAPAALLLRANDFLSDRVIHLSIRGTFSRPNIRIRPFETLGEEAVRFFLRQSTGGVVGGRRAVMPN